MPKTPGQRKTDADKAAIERLKIERNIERRKALEFRTQILKNKVENDALALRAEEHEDNADAAQRAINQIQALYP